MLFAVSAILTPLDNPVLIFTLFLFILLFSLVVLNKINIPHLIGLVFAGAIIGPHGLSLMQRNSSIILFGTVGLLYIMFLSGIDIDHVDFKKNRFKSLIFGLYTFVLPLIMGTAVSMYILHYSLFSSILIGSMLASHTLLAYPIIGKLGITKNRTVSLTVGGTMISNTLALIILAIIVDMAKGDINNGFWFRFSLSVTAFGLFVILIYPIVARWFFKRYSDNISHFIFVLALVFFASFLADVAGIESIIGAFLAGLSLNRLIPRTSPLMNRIEFVGNAIFIPFFLIGVGMLIDFRSFFKDKNTLLVSLVMSVVAIFSKYIAAWLTQKSFRFTKEERQLIFGLSIAQVAATLAVVLVGYDIITGYGTEGEPIRLLNDAVLNGTIIMILITCTISSLVTQKAAQNIALQDKSQVEISESEERILIPVNNIDTVEELINLSITIKSKHNKSGLYGLNIINHTTEDDNADKKARKILHKAAITAAATDNHLHELLRYDLNVSNGITSAIKENKITDLILGLHYKKSIIDSFLGILTESILSKNNITTLIYKPYQPLSTIKRHIIVIPEKAELEEGFAFWVIKVWNIARNTGSQLLFYASPNTISYLQDIQKKHPISVSFVPFSDWNDFLIISRDVKNNDNLIVVMSRKDYPSYNSHMSKVTGYLNKYFQQNNFILIYPMQSGVNGNNSAELANPSILKTLRNLDDIGKNITKSFRKM